MATTVTASQGPASLTSRRDTSNQWGNWSEARWDAVMNFSAAIPASAEIQSAVLTVNVTQDPICGPYFYVDGQQVRASMGAKTVNLSVTPGTASKTVSITFKGTGTTYSVSTMVLSLSLVVTYVIKTSTLALSSASVNAGGSVTATIGAYSSEYTHTLTLALGSKSQSWNLAGGVTSQAMAVPLSWLDQMTGSNVAVATVRLDTKSGGSVIGSVSQPLTVTAPSSSGPTFDASCVPLYTVGGVTYPSPAGGYVKGKSGVTASLAAPAGQYGATVKQTSINIGGLSGSGYNASGAGALSLASGLLMMSGSVEVTFRATDSRGITTEKKVTLTVADYAPPVMTVLSGMRCDADGNADSMGTLCWYEVAWTHASLGGANSCTAALSLWAKGESEWQAMTSDAGSGQSGILAGGSGPAMLEQAKAYELRLTLTDAYGAVSFVSTVPSAKFVRTVNRALNAVAYGKAAEHQDSFEVDAGLDVWCYGRELKGWMEDTSVGAVRTARAWNLLDNSDFARPVNQRGVASWYASIGIDRWYAWPDANDYSANVTDNGINASISGGSGTTVVILQQRLEKGTINPNKAYTIAVCYVDGTIRIGHVTGDGQEDNVNPTIGLSNSSFDYVSIYIQDGQTVAWAALYEGTYTAETLPPYVPKGYAAELMECKRYFRTSDWSTERNMPLIGYASSATLINAFLMTDVPMRAVPSMSNRSGGNWLIAGNGGRLTASAVNTWYTSNNALALRFTVTGAAVNETYIIAPATATTVVFSADL